MEGEAGDDGPASALRRVGDLGGTGDDGPTSPFRHVGELAGKLTPEGVYAMRLRSLEPRVNDAMRWHALMVPSSSSPSTGRRGGISSGLLVPVETGDEGERVDGTSTDTQLSRRCTLDAVVDGGGGAGGCAARAMLIWGRICL